MSNYNLQNIEYTLHAFQREREINSPVLSIFGLTAKNPRPSSLLLIVRQDICQLFRPNSDAACWTFPVGNYRSIHALFIQNIAATIPVNR